MYSCVQQTLPTLQMTTQRKLSSASFRATVDLYMLSAWNDWNMNCLSTHHDSLMSVVYVFIQYLLCVFQHFPSILRFNRSNNSLCWFFGSPLVKASAGCSPVGMYFSCSLPLLIISRINMYFTSKCFILWLLLGSSAHFIHGILSDRKSVV